MDRKQLIELVDEKNASRSSMARIVRESPTDFLINDHKYSLVKDDDKSFDFDEFTKKYSPALSKYDYIVGEWGYGQLKLQGFYEVSRNQVPGPFIDDLGSYILENFNFGYEFFVIHNLEVRNITKKPRSHYSDNKKNRNRRSNNKRNNAYIEQKVTKQKSPINKRDTTVSTNKKDGNHKFVIKEKSKE